MYRVRNLLMDKVVKYKAHQSPYDQYIVNNCFKRSFDYIWVYVFTNDITT